MDQTVRDKVERTFSLKGVDQRILFGQHGAYTSIIEDRFKVRVSARGDEAFVAGQADGVLRFGALVEDLIRHVERTGELSDRYLFYAMAIVEEDGKGPSEKLATDVPVTAGRQAIKPKTVGQQEYLKSIENYDITFCIGPAGTGKTYLAVAMAVAELKSKLVNRLVLVRPAVEAGESLGFLPGDIRAKVDPYLRPVYDALHDMMSVGSLRKALEMGTIEIAPLAFMRGRTLNHSFVILDEAQNTTPQQMKMFLTRLGGHSKAVITGDVTQIDLEQPERSGLLAAQRILGGIKGINFAHLTDVDVVRHRLVSEVIRAYERHENHKRNRNNGPGTESTD